jgi:hypothetical protein
MKFSSSILFATLLLATQVQNAPAFAPAGVAPLTGNEPRQNSAESAKPEPKSVTVTLPLTTPHIASFELQLLGGRRTTPTEIAAALTGWEGESAEQKNARREAFSAAVSGLTGAKLVGSDKAPVDLARFEQLKPDGISLVLNVSLLDPPAAAIPLAVVNDVPITIGQLNEALTSIHMGREEGQKVEKQSFAEILKRLENIQLIVQEGREIGFDRLDEVKELTTGAANKKLREMLLTTQLKTITVDHAEIERQYTRQQTEWRLKFLQFNKKKNAENFMKALKKKGNSFDSLYTKSLKDKSAIGDAGNEHTPSEALQPEMLKAIDKTGVGGITPLVENAGHFFIAKILDKRSRPDNPQLKEQITQEAVKNARLKTFEAYRDELIKKLATRDEKLIKELDLEAPEPGLASYREDKRVLISVKDETPVTVSDLIAGFEKKYFHGVERLIKEKKLNKNKEEQLAELAGYRVLLSEARSLGLNKSSEYLNSVRETEEMTIFGALIEKVIRADIKVTPQEVEAYYKEHINEYKSPERISLELVPFKTAKAAEEAAKKLVSGMDLKWLKENIEGYIPLDSSEFEDVPQEITNVSSLPEKLAKAVGGVQKGDIRIYAGTAQSSVVLVKELVPVSTLPQASVEGAIRTTLLYAKLNEAVASYAEKLRAQADIRVYLDFGK